MSALINLPRSTNGERSASYFGVKPDALKDNTQAMQKARDWLKNEAKGEKLIFLPGAYLYEVSPNWGISGAHIEAKGDVRLRYEGTGNAVIVDAGTTALDLVFNMKMKGFIVEAKANALNGVYVRSIHHSGLDFNVRGAGAASSGMLVEFAVCSNFQNFTCSVNEEGWYLGAKPRAGLTLSRRLAGETASYCLFDNPILEGPAIGVELLHTLGNMFNCGTSEACTEYGVYAGPSASNDTFTGTDFEVNGIADVYAQGNFLTLQNCNSEKLVAFGSTAFLCGISGGGHNNILIDNGAINCFVTDTHYNRIQNGGTFVDGGTNTHVSNVIEKTTNSRWLTGQQAVDFGTIAPSATAVIVLNVAGAKLGDGVTISMTSDLSGLTVTGVVTGPDQVKAYFTNNITGQPVTPPAGIVRAVVHRG